MAASGWLRGKVKAVTSGDCLLIMGSTKAEIPPEKSITLSYLMAPRLVRFLLHLTKSLAGNDDVVQHFNLLSVFISAINLEEVIG
jgi:hypothetical protein